MKINELAVTAASIIFENEGRYGSVNKNDNGEWQRTETLIM